MSYNNAIHNFTGALPEHILKHLEPIQSVRRFKHGEVIHERGDRGSSLSIVRSGAVKMGNYGLDGRYFLTKVLYPGESFGEFVVFAELHRTHTAEAVGDTEIGYIEKHDIEKALGQSPELAIQLLTSLSARLHNNIEIMDDIKRLPISVRLAKMLLITTQHSSSVEHEGKPLTIDVTQDNIAAQMGISRMSVSKALKELTKLGFIEQGYQAITITDITAMQAWYKEQNQTMPLKTLTEGKQG